MLIDEGWLSSDSDAEGQGTVPNSGAILLFYEGLGESEEERARIDTVREEVRAINHLDDGNPLDVRRRGILSAIR